MQVSRANLVLPLLLVFCLCAASSAQQAGRIESMKLLTPDVGWAATKQHLFWTTTGGHQWSDITPKTTPQKNIASVFFLDTSTAWVLEIGTNEKPHQPQFDIATTSNGGTSWSVNPVKIAHLNSEATTLSGDGRIDFLDSLHGWMNLGVVSSSNFRLGILLATVDGGKTWDWVPESPGVSGRVRFFTSKDGWLAGGPGDEKLYVTHDGSRSWQEVALQAPAEARTAVYPTYDQPPIFRDDGRGFLAVTLSGPEGTRSALVLFASVDAGRTWKPDRVLLNAKGTSPGQTFPSALADSIWITASVSGPAPALTRVAPGGVESNPRMDVSVPDSAFLQLSFLSGSRGWVLANGRLLSTTDSGTTWTEVTPAMTPSQTPARPVPHLAIPQP